MRGDRRCYTAGFKDEGRKQKPKMWAASGSCQGKGKEHSPGEALCPCFRLLTSRTAR